MARPPGSTLFKPDSAVASNRVRRLRLAAWYSLALGIYFLVFGADFVAVLHFPDLLIAPIMALGSFVAGSTFLGGGSVAFPALTKLMAVDPLIARTFSLAIQSVGMTSASLYILHRVGLRHLPLRFIGLYLAGSWLGVSLSLWLFQGLLTSTDLRVGFTLFILCFLVIYLWTLKTRNNDEYSITHLSPGNCAVVLAGGLVGGIISGQLGTGADVVAFSLMALFFHVNLRLATQVSVIIMASTSLVGTAVQGLVLSGIDDQVSRLWTIAAPVVLIGAPAGAVFCHRISKSWLVIFICLIVGAEVLSTLLLVEVEPGRVKFYALACLVGGIVLFLLKHYSALDRGRPASPVPKVPVADIEI